MSEEKASERLDEVQRGLKWLKDDINVAHSISRSQEGEVRELRERIKALEEENARLERDNAELSKARDEERGERIRQQYTAQDRLARIDKAEFHAWEKTKLAEQLRKSLEDLEYDYHEANQAAEARVEELEKLRSPHLKDAALAGAWESLCFLAGVPYDSDAASVRATIREDAEAAQASEVERLRGAEQVAQEWRQVAERLGFGDNITEPQATPTEVEDNLADALQAAHEHDECPVMCEPCGETLADTTCDECHGAGGFNHGGALAECEECAGAGKIHPGCAEASYADLVDGVRIAGQELDRLRDELDATIEARDNWSSGYATADAERLDLRAKTERLRDERSEAWAENGRLRAEVARKEKEVRTWWHEWGKVAREVIELESAVPRVIEPDEVEVGQVVAIYDPESGRGAAGRVQTAYEKSAFIEELIGHRGSDGLRGVNTALGRTIVLLADAPEDADEECDR